MQSESSLEEIRRLCPRCRTLNHLTAEKCFRPDCAEQLMWVRSFGVCDAALRRQLTVDQFSRLQWSLRLQSPLGTLALELFPGQQLPTELPGWPGTLEWSCNGGSVTTLQGIDCSSQALPAELVAGNTRLQIWFQPELPTGLADKRLNPQTTGSWPLSTGVIAIGRLSGNEIVILDSEASGIHALVWQMEASPGKTAWLADLGSASGTFVNRRRIDVTPLEDGDFVQITSAGFVYNAADRLLQSVSALTGAELTLRNVTLNLPEVRRPISLTVTSGEFVLFCGESGAGKSTLAKAIVGHSECRRNGDISLSADGHHRCQRRDYGQYRQQIGYVPQDSIIHEELTAKQVWNHLSLLRLTAAPAISADELFGRLGLAHEVLTRPIAQLSGGENKRVRTTLELLHQPGLVVLDEPDSGLNAERQQELFRLLRGLAYQGCTLVVVTHAPIDVLRYADRVIALHQAAVVFDGTPTDYLAWKQAGSPDSSSSLPAETQDYRESAGSDHQPSGPGVWRQTRGLLTREAALWTASHRAMFSRLLLPIGVVPCLFATALGISVPGDQTGLLGFLAILSVIWMSASLSVGAIAGERNILNHEQRLYLTPPPYLTAKMIATGLLSLLQTTVFFAALIALRWILQRQHLLGGVTTLVVLIVTGGAAVSLGLLLSALVGRHREAGAALLPFVILLQLVCSVAVVRDVNNSYEGAYEDFHYWPTQPTAEKSVESHFPDRVVAAMSHLTFSRPADEALRSYAYNVSDYDQWKPAKSRRILQSLLWLTFMGATCLLATGWLLGLGFRRN